MADVLSQSEIDELLSALSSGELAPEQVNDGKDKQQIKKYDFKSPKKFSKEHLRTLEMIHESYARIIGSYLAAQTRTNIEIKVAVIEQVTYEEFNKSISSPTMLTVYRLPPLSGSLMLETGPQFVFQILDILFGGSGTTVFKTREFTEIEKNVISGINKSLVESFKPAWEDVLDVEPEILSVETNPALNQTIAPNEPVALISLSVKINNLQSYINICIPYLAVEKVLDRLVVRYWFTDQDEKDRKVSRNKIEKRIQNVPLDMTTYLGRCTIPIKSFLDLKLGDVIMLDGNVESPIETFIEDKPYYKTVPGTLNKKKAVRIVEIMNKDVNEDEQ